MCCSLGSSLRTRRLASSHVFVPDLAENGADTLTAVDGVVPRALGLVQMSLNLAYQVDRVFHVPRKPADTDTDGHGNLSTLATNAAIFYSPADTLCQHYGLRITQITQEYGKSVVFVTGQNGFLGQHGADNLRDLAQHHVARVLSVRFIDHLE